MHQSLRERVCVRVCTIYEWMHINLRVRAGVCRECVKVGVYACMGEHVYEWMLISLCVRKCMYEGT